jgi:copper(I)-binding protein
MRIMKCGLAGFMLVSLGAWSDLSDHSEHSAHAAHQNELHIMQGWVRALPPTQKVTAAYLTLHNAGSTNMVVNRFSSDISDRVELHDSVLREGQMRMRRLDSLTLATDEHQELAPGGLHLMLMDLESMPREGETVTVCVASNEIESCAALPVLRSAPQSMDAMPHHNHH